MILRKAYRFPSYKVFHVVSFGPIKCNFSCSLSLTALEKSTTDEEKQQPEHDDNAQTIRPTNRSPRSLPGVISKSPSRDIVPIVEDYSDLGIDEDDEWQEKFADFKMKTSVRRGLIHPNDIKTVGLAPASPSARSAPLPDVMGHSRTQSHPVTPLSASPFTGQTSTRSHSRSPSFAGSSNGSLGRSGVRRLASQEFNKYAEDDDEDYDDVFGKPNGSCAYSFFWFCLFWYATLSDVLTIGCCVLDSPGCCST